MKTVQEVGDILDNLDQQIKETKASHDKFKAKVEDLQGKLRDAMYGMRNTESVLNDLSNQREETLLYLRALAQDGIDKEISF